MTVGPKSGRLPPLPIPDLNPATIPDLALRQVVVELLNLIEAQAADIATLRGENQQLRDALARLKGGSGKPAIKPPVPPPPADHASEAERRTRTPRGKPPKNPTLTVTREERCVVDPATLPPDALRHETTTGLVQDLRIAAEVIRFVREVWYVPSTKTTSTAPLPPGYQGAFGPTLRALALALGHGANVSQPALRTFLRDVGVHIGTGTVARMRLDSDGQWAVEADAIHVTGMAQGDWVASDQTATRVDGQNEVCHVVGNALFTRYHTRPGGTRQDVLAVLWGQAPVFRLNAESLAWLSRTSLPAPLRKRLVAILPWETDLSADALQQQLRAGGITLTAQQQQQVGDALAVAASHAQTGVPVLHLLLSDDAAVYDHLTATHALCWVHDWRHYAKLRPLVPTIRPCSTPSGRTTGRSIAICWPIGTPPPPPNGRGWPPRSTPSSTGRRATPPSMTGSSKPPTSGRSCWRCSTIRISPCTTMIWNSLPGAGCANAT